LRVNVDGTRALLQACRAAGHVPRLLFSSSIAVFGGDLPAVVTDATTPTPQGSYGIQKLIGELLVQDYSRKGFIDGRAVRIPTVVVRPGRPNGAASGFASGIVREPLSGLDAILPVSPDTEMWLASPRAVVSMLLRALELSSQDWGWQRSLNLPGLTASMHEEIAAVKAAAGEAVAARIYDGELDTSHRLRIEIVPTLIRFEGGQEVARTYGWDRSTIGYAYGLTYVFAGTLGVLAGGWLSDWLASRGYMDSNLRTGVIAGLCALPFVVLFPLMPSGELAMVLLVPATFFGTMPFGAGTAALPLLTPNRMRAQMVALYLVVANLLGQGLGQGSVTACGCPSE
jgi:hypothetical protein